MRIEIKVIGAVKPKNQHILGAIKIARAKMGGTTTWINNKLDKEKLDKRFDKCYKAL